MKPLGIGIWLCIKTVDIPRLRAASNVEISESTRSIFEKETPVKRRRASNIELLGFLRVALICMDSTKVDHG